MKRSDRDLDSSVKVLPSSLSINTTATSRPFLGPSVDSCSASRGHHVEMKLSDLDSSIELLPSSLSIRTTLHPKAHLQITMCLELITECAMMTLLCNDIVFVSFR